MAVCLNCGAALRDGARFCTECGAQQDMEPAAPIGGPAALAAEEAPAFPAAPAFPVNEECGENAECANKAEEAAQPLTAPFAQSAFDPAMLQETPAEPGIYDQVAPPKEACGEVPAPVPPMPPAAPAIPSYPPEPKVKAADPERPGKKSRYAPMTSVGMALQLVLMSIPVVGFILMILWSCGVCRKITRRNLARAYLILFIIALVVLIIGALLLRFVFAEEFTGIFEQLVPGYTIQWG